MVNHRSILGVTWVVNPNNVQTSVGNILRCNGYVSGHLSGDAGSCAGATPLSGSLHFGTLSWRELTRRIPNTIPEVRFINHHQALCFNFGTVCYNFSLHSLWCLRIWIKVAQKYLLVFACCCWHPWLAAAAAVMMKIPVQKDLVLIPLPIRSPSSLA